MLEWIDGLTVSLALGVALWLRPWRVHATVGLPWPWLAWATLMPAFWSADRLVAMPVAQPLSGACLLMLMTGWPLAMLLLVPIALLAGWAGDLGAWATLHRLAWLGVVPATLALALGAAIRRWLPHHLFVYIMGRGFLGAAVCTALAGAGAAWIEAAPGGLLTGDIVLGRWLAAWADAWLCGMIAAIFVAFRPTWLATYADRIYLPPQTPT